MKHMTQDELVQNINQLEARLNNMEILVAYLEARLSKIESNFMPTNRIGITVEELKEELKRPFKRSPEAIERARGIIGIGNSGVGDLSENLHEYLYGNKREK
jgi:hypothetical protein